MTPRRRMRAVAPRAETNARRRRLVTIGAALALAMALAGLTNQYAKTYTLARDEARLEQRRRDLIADNARLRDEIERLQTDDRYIEQIAREQLGLVRPGEVELLVVPYDGTVSAPGATWRGSEPGRTNVDNGSGAAAPRTGAAPSSRRESDRGGNGTTPPTQGGAAAPPRPHRGIGVWATGVRDAVLRLLRTPRR
ncbi:MAG TPA: septum formation initiator family protein [bacterium]|nr:septum formation initiator family protein [bacterium]